MQVSRIAVLFYCHLRNLHPHPYRPPSAIRTSTPKAASWSR